MVIGIEASRLDKTHKTGTEQYARAIIRALAAIEGPDRFVIYSMRPLEDSLSRLGPRVTSRVLRWPPKRLWTQLRLSLEMFIRPPDVLFVPAHTIPVLHPKATLTMIHDVGFDRSPELYSPRELAYHRWGVRFALRHAAKILVPSHFTKQELLDLYPVSDENIVVVPHGVDPAPFQGTLPEPAELTLQRYGIHQPFLLYIGRLQEKKNTPRLVEAFSKLCARRTDLQVQLVLVGQEDFGFQRVQQLLSDPLLRHRVVLPGYVAAQDLPILLRAARGFVFPSLYEGFGFPVLEAQASGIPVLTSRVASLPEVGGDGALYVDPLSVEELSTGMERLLVDEALRSSLQQKGMRNIQRFSWSRCAQKTLQAIKTVADSKLR